MITRDFTASNRQGLRKRRCSSSYTIFKEDPQELKNLARDEGHAALLARMRQRTDELRDANGGTYSPERFPLLQKKKK